MRWEPPEVRRRRPTNIVKVDGKLYIIPECLCRAVTAEEISCLPIRYQQNPVWYKVKSGFRRVGWRLAHPRLVACLVAVVW